MKFFTIVTFICLFVFVSGKSQDSSLTFKKVASFDSLPKDKIYEKALVWCGKTFNNSNYAIRAQDKEGGIISGKGYCISPYYMPRKNDSTIEMTFAKYYFDWLIEVKDNRLRFSVTNIENELTGEKSVVYINDEPPKGIYFQKRSKTIAEWNKSKLTLLWRFDSWLSDLYKNISTKEKEW